MSTLTVSNISNGSVSTSSTNVIQGSAKAWVNFNGTGTVAIRASYNVSSITDNGTGDYTINFTNALPDANYSICGTAGNTDTSGSIVYSTAYQSAPTTSAFRAAITNTGGTNVDRTHVFFSVFD